MFHTAGLFAAARVPLLAGGTVLISQKFDAPVTYERLADRRLGISHYFCVTQMAMMMRQLPGFDGRRLAHLTALITGGAPNPEAHILRWLDDGVMMVNGWGMSEICSALAQPVGDLERIRAHPAAVGLPHLTVEMKLMDSEGREVGRRRSRARSGRAARTSRPATGAGRELNATAFQDGWFRHGRRRRARCGRLLHHRRSHQGHVHLRRRERVSRGGRGHHRRARCGGGRGGHRHSRCDNGARWAARSSSPAPGKSLDAPTLEAHCLRRLAKFKVPQRFEILETLPRTPSGKVQKHLLRAEFERKAS